MDRVPIADRDPELLAGLDPASAAVARERLVAQTIEVPEGPWPFENERFGDRDHMGLLILEGLLAREVVLHNRMGVDLLGPSDLIRPWVHLGEGTSISLETNWEVTEPATLAVLDGRFARTAAAWPPITSALMDRLALRAHWLAFHIAVCHIRRVDVRLAVVLWYFADRWGRVTPEGVVLPVRFTHRLLAGVIGAERASVSKGLKKLRENERVKRRPNGHWLLLGEPPPELNSTHERSFGGGGSGASD